jgi:4-amino-4-deoxy-L-arabinose transferase-like glycosyltransferase
VSTRGLYGGSLAVVAALGAVVVGLASPDIRPELASGIGLGLLVQAPLGWFTVRSVGTERFQLVWVLGMVIRLAVVALVALVLVPVVQWQMIPTLAALVATILVLLFVEVLTVMRHNSGIRAR